MSLSDRLREAMQDAGINQRELARRCAVSPPSVNGWLSGKAKFLRGENLLRAASVLNVSDHWLATGKGPKLRSSGAVQESRADYETGATIDPAIVFDVARALQEAHEELGLAYDFTANPQLFIDAYQRAVTFGNFSEGRGNAWLGSHITLAAPQGAHKDERATGTHAQGVHQRTTGGRARKA